MSAANWPEVVVKDVCESVIDCVNKTAPIVEYKTPYKMIRTTNVKNGVVNIDSVRYVEKDVFEKWTRRAIPQVGDVILTREAPLGDVGMLITPGEKIFLGQRLMQYRANPEKLDNYFLLYALQESFMQGQLKAAGSGSTVEHVRVGDAENLKIRLPDLQTQKEISSILKAYDNLIENNNRRIAILEEIAQSIYSEWFIKFRFPGHENTKFIDSPLGKIPEGWVVKPIGEVIGILGGGTPSKVVPEYWNEDEADINWYTPSDLTKSSSMFMEESSLKITDIGLAKSSAKLFPSYSVMMTSRATIGVISINTTPACTNQGFIVCIPNEHVNTEYIYYWLHANMQAIDNLASGATFKEVRRTLFKELPFLVPTSEVHEVFCNVVKPIVNLIERLGKKNSILKNQRDSLLPKLISGKISINNK